MKKLFLFIIVLLAGCTSSKLTYVYKTADYNPASFSKMAVIAMVPSDHARVEIENAFVEQLRSNGIKAVTTWSTFVFASNPELLKQAGFTGEKRKEIIRQKVTENGIDAILLITLFDAKREQRYVPGTTTSVGVGVGMPYYGYPYASYVGYAWEVTSEPGYYKDASKYFFETNLYDIASEKLLWTGQTRTDMNYTLEQEVIGFSRLVVNQLMVDCKKPLQ